MLASRQRASGWAEAELSCNSVTFHRPLRWLHRACVQAWRILVAASDGGRHLLSACVCLLALLHHARRRVVAALFGAVA